MTAPSARLTRRALTVALALNAALLSACGAPEAEAPSPAAVPDPAMAPEALLTVAQVMEAAPDGVWIDPDPDNVIYIDTPDGRIIVELTAHLAPAHVAQVKTLVREGYYDGLNFYRVIEGFVAQGGDESGGKPKGSAAASLVAEFEEPMRDDIPFQPLGFPDGYASEAGFIDGMPAGRDPQTGTVWLAHCTGAFAFGRENGRDTASTEFYITLQPQRYLDRNLTVFGRVLLGMDVAQAMPRAALGNGGVIEDRTRWTPITSVRIEADVPDAERTNIEIMDTSSDTFRQLIKARSARGSEFFYYRPHYIDLCQMPLPVRLSAAGTP